MQPSVVLVERLFAGVTGALLIYSSLFLHKEEEGELENVIEQWWQKIRHLQTHAVSQGTAFLKVVAGITAKGFARIFGERLFGPKALAASICYSQAAILLCFLILDAFNFPQLFWSDVLQLGIPSVFFLTLGSLGPFIDRQSRKWFWLSSAVIAAVAWTPLCDRLGFLNFGSKADYIALGSMIPFSVACDFLFIALTRAMLIRAAQSNSFIKITAFATGNACLATLLIGLPLAAAWLVNVPSSDNLFVGPPASLPVIVRNGLFFLGLSNFLDGLVSLAWFLVAIVMLIHRIFWPLVERPVYALYRYRVFSEQKKLVFFSGVALLGLAIPSVGRAIENLVKVVHG